MTYAAPVEEMAATLKAAAGLERAVADGLYGDLTVEDVTAVLEEAARFAGDVIAPLNRPGDAAGTPLENGVVTLPAAHREAYKAWAEAGWNALPGPEEFGGQGLPLVVSVACTEMWNAASMAFSLGPLLTIGAVEALEKHGSDELKERYLAKLVSGEWMGTMNLTEPQAGSDLAALRAKAERAGDGTYLITGTKIFITYGEHDLTDNIVHLVLARLPDAPAGTRGISLFLVPKILPDGSRNDLRCSGIEHKLGIHGSPTCTMSYGDDGGATGWLIGEENRGLACMFTMMNNARLNVGIQGVAIAERAYQGALAYAKERRQGRAPGASGPGMSPIIEHPDIRRMLLTMKAQTAASRAICYRTAAALDRARLAGDPAERERAAAQGALLTPVAKAYSTDIGVEVASLGIQVHGGMGFIEETGAAQHLRDSRIAPIYEGTNGIQAIDLVTRKLPLAGGEAVRAEIASMRATVRALMNKGEVFGMTAARLRDAVESLDRATSFLQRALAGNDPTAALAGATPYLRLFGLASGGTLLAEIALAAGADEAGAARIALCRFFAENIAVGAAGLEASVVDGGGFAVDAALALAS
ncbi:acyl-CoA dehydrogenase [Enterovirga rhinocerotis]|uniref:3-methylmercaptopropionyl-CoA dehydrogenase n=1 Tax=Enterovirga rhinocerotis TaxID=1339210 RepID=A0A4R7CAC6_9HYPH|nr:acyl-CoA dehydrogenase [Enterovirga rhinocerotis]TDR94325.1 butyryl-CoA dehydrogenase [Enterovirga rhinocerotis]